MRNPLPLAGHLQGTFSGLCRRLQERGQSDEEGSSEVLIHCCWSLQPKTTARDNDVEQQSCQKGVLRTENTGRCSSGGCVGGVECQDGSSADRRGRQVRGDGGQPGSAGHAGQPLEVRPV